MRDDKDLTSRTGYAGGKLADSEGKVCYHNEGSIADYGELGHGEVVGMRIPEFSIGQFAQAYFNIFAANGERVDPGDKGPEYRSIVGLPGGTSHALYSEVERAAQSMGMVLIVGNGNDPDTYGTKSVFVYNSIKFPFYQAEVFNQYHDDFQSPPYGKVYNDLRIQALEDRIIEATGCPDDTKIIPSYKKMSSSTSTPTPFFYAGLGLGLFFFHLWCELYHNSEIWCYCIFFMLQKKICKSRSI